jgi:hypothetical protein
VLGRPFQRLPLQARTNVDQLFANAVQTLSVDLLDTQKLGIEAVAESVMVVRKVRPASRPLEGR